jgi:hypothetical protein
LETNPFNCFHVSFEDSQKLKALPVGAKLYLGPVAPAQVQAPGWKLVPLEPAREMLDDGIRLGDVSIEEIYRAMLAAAPLPPAPTKENNHGDIYKASTDSDGKFYCQGPEEGNTAYFGYHGGYLFPESRFETREEADKVAKLLNKAFATGQEAAKAAIRGALGVTK